MTNRNFDRIALRNFLFDLLSVKAFRESLEASSKQINYSLQKKDGKLGLCPKIN